MPVSLPHRSCCGWPSETAASSNSSQATSQAIEPLTAPDSQWRALKQWIADQENWTIVEDRDTFLQCVAITPLMRFRDDIQLLYRPDPELIHVRSSSRMGISDMGANRRRVELLRDELEQLRSTD